MARRLVAVSTSGKCAICKSGAEKRARVDELLSRHGEQDGDGVVTWEWLERRVPLILGRSLAISSMKRHVAGHSRWVEDGGESAEPVEPEWVSDEERQAIIAELQEIAADPLAGASRLLAVQERMWALQSARKLAKGEDVSVTADQAARAASARMNSEKTREQSILLGLLGQGIERAFQKTLGSHDEKPAELEAGEIIEEAEVEPVEGG